MRSGIVFKTHPGEIDGKRAPAPNRAIAGVAITVMLLFAAAPARSVAAEPVAAPAPVRELPAPDAVAREPEAADIPLGRLSVRVRGFSTPSDREFEHALEHSKAQEQSAERMAAALAGEQSLYHAEKLHGQAKLDFLEEAARAGDAAAASELGERLDLGDGPKEDATRAFGYFRAAAVGGRMEAAHNVGAAYSTGRGVRRNFSEGLAWLIVARGRGDRSGADAQLRRYLATHQPASVVETAEKRARELRPKGRHEEVIGALPPAAPMVFIADATPSGEVLNATRARDPEETAAGDGGDDAAAAAREIVVMTILGERLTWPTLEDLQRAANRGEPAALGALGRLLAAGKGLPEDPLRAAVLLERSAALGDVDAAQQLGDLYSDGAKLVRDDAKAFAGFMQAARGGSTLAMASVGVCFTNGRGTKKDYVQGLAWLAVAKHYRIDLGQEGQLRTFLGQHRPGDVAKADGLAAQLIKEIDAAREHVR